MRKITVTNNAASIDAKTLWMARDKSGALCCFLHKPVRMPNQAWYDDLAPFQEVLPSCFFPNLTWLDDPIQVRVKMQVVRTNPCL